MDNIIKINKISMNSPIKIVFLGEVKAGKSTLVNAILGKKVRCTNILEATASIVEINYSSDEKCIIYKKDKRNIELDSLSELDDFINKTIESLNSIFKELNTSNEEIEDIKNRVEAYVFKIEHS